MYFDVNVWSSRLFEGSVMQRPNRLHWSSVGWLTGKVVDLTYWLNLRFGTDSQDVWLFERMLTRLGSQRLDIVKCSFLDTRVFSDPNIAFIVLNPTLLWPWKSSCFWHPPHVIGVFKRQTLVGCRNRDETEVWVHNWTHNTADSTHFLVVKLPVETPICYFANQPF